MIGWQVLSGFLFLTLLRAIYVKTIVEIRKTAKSEESPTTLGSPSEIAKATTSPLNPSPQETQRIDDAKQLRQAKRQADASWATFFVVLAALIVSAAAAIYAERAFVQSRRQADAAEKQLSVMQSAERPWIGIDSVDRSAATVEGIWIKNGGESPALNVRINPFHWEDGENAVIPDGPCFAKCEITFAIAMPGFSIGIRFPNIGEPNPSVNKAFYFGARIDYTDTSYFPHVTVICLKRDHGLGQPLTGCHKNMSNYAD
jgi:hypothetical protein